MVTQSNKNLFSHTDGGHKSEIKELAEQVPSGCSEENLFHARLLASGGSVNPLFQSLPPSSYGFLRCLSIRTPKLDLERTVNLKWFYLKILNYICKTSLSKQGHFHMRCWWRHGLSFLLGGGRRGTRFKPLKWHDQ